MDSETLDHLMALRQVAGYLYNLVDSDLGYPVSPEKYEGAQTISEVSLRRRRMREERKGRTRGQDIFRSTAVFSDSLNIPERATTHLTIKDPYFRSSQTRGLNSNRVQRRDLLT